MKPVALNGWPTVFAQMTVTSGLAERIDFGQVG
jgi:hypothetical protein